MKILSRKKKRYIFLVFAQNIDCGYMLELRKISFFQLIKKSLYKPRCEKTGFRGFRPGPTRSDTNCVQPQRIARGSKFRI